MTSRFFFFKQKTAYEIMPSLVGSEMCIRDRVRAACPRRRAAEGRGLREPADVTTRAAFHAKYQGRTGPSRAAGTPRLTFWCARPYHNKCSRRWELCGPQKRLPLNPSRTRKGVTAQRDGRSGTSK